jgi:hypothetical protein
LLLEARDESFDLALAVLAYDAARHTVPAPGELAHLYLDMRDRAERLVAKIAGISHGSATITSRRNQRLKGRI